MIEITRPGKRSILLENPVIVGAGMMGFDTSTYRQLIKLEKLGAMVTAPLSWRARGPSRGARIVDRSSGFLMHTGLPNPGIRNVLKNYREAWKKSPLPVIVHLMDSRPEDLHSCAKLLDAVEGVVGLELGLREDVEFDELEQLIKAVHNATQLPLTVKLPLYSAPWLAPAAEDFGADGLVVAAPPRGTDRDPISGKLVGGRLYGTFLKPLVLRAVGQVASMVDVPVVACGGIHNSSDARDYIEAGAKAVQIDTLLWVSPQAAEVVARNLGGHELTREIGALFDEWEPGIGHTVMMKRKSAQSDQPSGTGSNQSGSQEPPPPPAPPELPLGDDDNTMPADPDQWLK